VVRHTNAALIRLSMRWFKHAACERVAAAPRKSNQLAGHYGAIKQYLEATAAGTEKRQDAAMKSLPDNAGGTAVFLSDANPNLPRDTVRGLFLTHGGHHVQQIQNCTVSSSSRKRRPGKR